MNNSDDAAFLHTFTILLLGLTAVGIFAFILASIVADNAKSKQPTEKIVLERTKPVGKINTGKETVIISSVQSASPTKIREFRFRVGVRHNHVFGGSGLGHFAVGITNCRDISRVVE